jgi:hypothetical protein
VPRSGAKKGGVNIMIEEANKEKLRGCEGASVGKVLVKDPARNIINFELGRRAVEKDSFQDERDRMRLVEPDRLSCKLSFDWLELLLTIMLLFGSLSAVVGGLIVSWWS